VVACASGRASEGLIERAVTSAVERTHQRPLCWFSDGWQSYQNSLMQAYRQPVMTGKRGRPRLVVPDTLSLTQTVKHRDEHGRLLSVEIRAALGASLEPAGTVHIERLNGTLRDRLGALTRKTHAFAKRDATWDDKLIDAGFPGTKNWDGITSTKNCVKSLNEYRFDSLEERNTYIKIKKSEIKTDPLIESQLIIELNNYFDKLRE